MTLTIPGETIDALRTVFWIENGLRELIIEELSRVAGVLWFKSRLPGDVLEKYRDGKKFERSVKWTKLVPHHPLYYIDFADLRKIVERNDNWSACFAKIFGSTSVIIGSLTQIDFVRNKLAHNRIIGSEDLDTLIACLEMLLNCVGPDRYGALVERSQKTCSIKLALQSLRGEAESLFIVATR